MRIWSLHPKYLDSKGLLALWREALLAKNVLEGKTKGYKNHPQLNRFKSTVNPVHSIHYYLKFVQEEAEQRNYRFDKDKIDFQTPATRIAVTTGQLDFERLHLSRKLAVRAPQLLTRITTNPELDLHPMFDLTVGPVADWEIL